MSKQVRKSKRQMLGAEGSLPQDSILSDASGQILVTAESLRAIANHITKSIKRQLTTGEIAQLDQFINRLPGSQFSGATLAQAQQKIAGQFINRYKMWDEVAEERDNLSALLHLTNDNEFPTVDDAERAELMGLTDNENPLKFSMFNDRRGRSIISRERAGEERLIRNRGTPNSYLNQEGRDLEEGMSSTSSESFQGNLTDPATATAAFRNQQRVNKELMKYLRAMNSTFNAETIPEIFARSTNNLITFESVTIPHQVIPLDTRFRLVNSQNAGHGNTEYKWNIHTSNDAGRPGDIRMQDTITQVMAMTICPFWIPVSNARYQYYDKVRMYIREFKEQSVQVNEFLDGDAGQITRTNYYHFEFLIDRREVNRIHLIPICPTFKFRLPIAQINTITVQFRSPFELITFNPDRLYFTVSNINPAVFTSTEDHQLATGDLVYVVGFEAGTQVVNRAVNDSAGYFVTRLSATQFSIPLDLTSLAGPVDNVEVQFGSKRIVTQIEFVSLEQ